MDKGLALIFPGQGAQYVGMGKDFFDTYPKARFVFQEADEILGTYLSKTIFQGPADDLCQTENSQPGIFVVSMAILSVFKEQLPHLKPRMTGGLSLGEYSALCAAEVLSFEEALKLVAVRAQYMNQACEQKKGAMAVILGLEPDAVEDINIENLWIANYNCPGQIVISGSVSAIEKASVIAKEKGAKRVLPLSVQGAFHSGYMKSAEKLLAERIEETLFCTPRLEVAMNVPGTFVKNIEDIKRFLVHQVTHSVRWQYDIEAMDAKEPALYIEMGPGKTLAGMNKKIGVKAPTISIEKVADLDQLG
ncbi:MAG: ACP S-malonyltransferase [Chlamydiae bacterium]|nr:ACP S-malonyltransferase [Chlamydiota bacterium]